LAGRLQPLLASRSPVKIFLTACGPGEGATTVAQRLADALTIDGARVLLCVGKEIRSVLAIDRAVEESRSGFVLNNSVASLHIVDISDLQGAEVDVSEVVAFKNWLAAQASRFDAIVVDMPPVLLRHSWLSIVDMPDGIILVVEAEHTRSMVLKTTAKLLQQAGGHILGIVFNKRRHRIPRGLYRWL
jgi:Mrp family chromosome partitioning ATPase